MTPFAWWTLFLFAFGAGIVALQRVHLGQLQREVDALVRMLNDERAILKRWQILAGERSKAADAGGAALVDLLAWAVDRADPIPVDDLLARGQQLLDAAGWSGEYPAGRKGNHG